jgi:hypothetical protein
MWRLFLIVLIQIINGLRPVEIKKEFIPLLMDHIWDLLQDQIVKTGLSTGLSKIKFMKIATIGGLKFFHYGMVFPTLINEI